MLKVHGYMYHLTVGFFFSLGQRWAVDPAILWQGPPSLSISSLLCLSPLVDFGTYRSHASSLIPYPSVAYLVAPVEGGGQSYMINDLEQVGSCMLRLSFVYTEIVYNRNSLNIVRWKSTNMSRKRRESKHDKYPVSKQLFHFLTCCFDLLLYVSTRAFL